MFSLLNLFEIQELCFHTYECAFYEPILKTDFQNRV